MSKIRNSAFAVAASVAVGAGSMAGAAPAQAAPSVCTTAHASVHCSMKVARTITHVLAPGARGYEVKQLQRALRQIGFPATVSGVYDSQTTKQVRRFQASRRIAATGVAGGHTLRALRIGLGPRQAVSAHKTARRTIVTSSSVSSRAQIAVNFAYAQLGKPYVWGATGPSSFDCSGLTGAAWAAAGRSIPRTAAAQWHGLQGVSMSNLQPGDLVIFYGGGHVGIYIGNGKVIHAPHTGDVVKIAPISYMSVAGAVRP